MSLLVVSINGAWNAEARSQVVWLTGSAFEAQLDAVIPRVFWSGVPLRAATRTLSTSQRIAILVDCRVDPDQPIDLSLSDVPIRTLLERIVEPRKLGLKQVGSVLYLGPSETAAIIRTLRALRHDDVAKLAPAAATTFRRSEPLAWEDFATPRDILSQLAQSAEIQLEGLDHVPHDLWAAADLPPLPWVDRMTLVAVQFGLTFRIAADGRSAELTPLPERLAVVRRYPGGRNPEQLAQQWSELLPSAQVKAVGNDVFVRGLIEDHEKIAAASGSKSRSQPKRVATPRVAAAKRQETRFTVQNAKGPLDRILAELGQKLGIEIRMDRQALEQAGISPHQPVTFNVKNATVEELLEAVLQSTGCTFRREGNVIVIAPLRR